MRKCNVFGLLDIGNYKIYRRGNTHYASCKDDKQMRRVALKNRAQAESIAALPLCDVGAHVERLLLAAKLAGSVAYYEMRHR